MFTKEEIKILADCELQMDNGAPFVVLNGSRLMCKQQCMDEFGLKQGQTINDVIFGEILKWNVAYLEAQIVEQKI